MCLSSLSLSIRGSEGSRAGRRRDGKHGEADRSFFFFFSSLLRLHFICSSSACPQPIIQPGSPEHTERGWKSHWHRVEGGFPVSRRQKELEARRSSWGSNEPPPLRLLVEAAEAPTTTLALPFYFFLFGQEYIAVRVRIHPWGLPRRILAVADGWFTAGAPGLSRSLGSGSVLSSLHCA